MKKRSVRWLVRKPTIVLTTLLVSLVWGCGSSPEWAEWDFESFSKPEENPVLRADPEFTFRCPVSGEVVQWQKADVFNPAAVVRNDTIFLLFRAEDNPEAILGGRTSRIGLATSTDGLHFVKYPHPVLYPDSGQFLEYDFPGGCEDPRVVETEDGGYVMTYTSWNREVARLSIAFSEDLFHWEKKGPAFAEAYSGRFLDRWSKSGSIVTRMVEDRPAAAKIDGKYWMYWGENLVNLAWSANLHDWYPQLDESGELKAVARPREGMFDSHLTECGPPAVITPEGIVLFYNGKNAEDESRDMDVPPGMYTVGKMVFDPVQPDRILSRTDRHLLRPTLPHEITGQYSSGTTFAEALVFYRSHWFLYYGTADSFVGVAISDGE